MSKHLLPVIQSTQASLAFACVKERQGEFRNKYVEPRDEGVEIVGGNAVPLAHFPEFVVTQVNKHLVINIGGKERENS